MVRVYIDNAQTFKIEVTTVEVEGAYIHAFCFTKKGNVISGVGGRDERALLPPSTLMSSLLPSAFHAILNLLPLLQNSGFVHEFILIMTISVL